MSPSDSGDCAYGLRTGPVVQLGFEGRHADPQETEGSQVLFLSFSLLIFY
jgi:hypothetical protein